MFFSVIDLVLFDKFSEFLVLSFQLFYLLFQLLVH